MELAVTQSFNVRNRSLNADGSPREAEIEYLVTGAEQGEDQAMLAVLRQAPRYQGTLALQYATISEKIDAETYRVTVSYEGPPEAEEGGGGPSYTVGNGAFSDPETEAAEAEQDARDDAAAPTISFSMSLGTEHVIVARDRRVLWTDGNAAYDPGLYIGWNGKKGQECSVEGCDSFFPQMQVTYSRTMRYRRITTAYVKACGRLGGKVNATSFKGWEPGELLFAALTFEGERKPSARITMNYTFQIRANESGYSFNGRNLGRRYGWEEVGAVMDNSLAVHNIVAFRPHVWASFAALNI